jgi:Flp pilus assembly protein TadG
MRYRLRDERGDAAIEAVLAVPVLLLMIVIVIQFGLWYHASHTLKAAAEEGVRTARVEGGSAAEGQVRAAQFMANAAPTLVEDVRVTATRDGENARVEVRGSVHALVQGLNLSVHAEAQSPVERFRADR